jgi:O-6-methylguanine DNA methyltransferase
MHRSQRQAGGDALNAVAIQTSAGTFLAKFSYRGLAQLDFPKPERARAAAAVSESPQAARWAKQTERAIEAVLRGESPRELPPLDLAAGTDFQRRVWGTLLRIGPGRTKCYSEIAAELKQPKGARAVGGACGRNPIPVLIPCHRVRVRGGKLGGFSGGLAWKERLLRAEGHQIQGNAVPRTH